MTSEMERLEGLYAGYTDGQVLDLDGDRTNLTDEAQAALAREMQRRGLAHEAETAGAERESGFGPGVAGVLASNIDVLDRLPGVQAGDAAEAGDGPVVLIGFFNGHDLATACAALDEAKIAFDVQTVGGDAQAGVPASFDVRIAPQDRAAAQTLLRERMQLFPLPEVTGRVLPADDGTLEVLGDFETQAEVDQVVAVLRGAGIAYKVIASEMVGEMFSVEVKEAQRESALALVAAMLGLAGVGCLRRPAFRGRRPPAARK